MPLFKTHALPLIKKGAEAVKTVANIATDAIKGKNLNESTAEHMNEALEL